MNAVLLDACVLYPIGLRDTLLNVAEAGFYRLLWTEEILAETSRNIVENTPGLTIEHLNKTFAAMRQAFPEAMVEGYEHRVEEMTNDPKDRHVLAAAVVGGADLVVTANLRHFPKSACSPHGIVVQSPDEFLCDALSARPGVMVAVIRAQAARKLRPPTTVDQMLERLALQVPTFVMTITPML